MLAGEPNPSVGGMEPGGPNFGDRVYKGQARGSVPSKFIAFVECRVGQGG